MEGLVYVVDKLGRSLAQAESENAQLRQENALLREQLAAKTDEPTDAPS